MGGGGGGGSTNTHSIWLPAGIRDNTVNRYLWHASAYTSALTGTTAPTQFVTISLPDSATTTLKTDFMFPTSWAGGAVDVTIYWSVGSAVSTGWRAAVRIACVGDGEDILAPTYNSDSLATQPNGGSSNRLNIDAFTSVAVTNCAAGELAVLNVERIGTDGADDMTQSVSFFGAMVKYTRNN
jgi:hypothetical protein